MNQITNSVIILIVIIYFFTKSNKAISLSPPQRLITAKIKARKASARFLTQYGVEPGGGGVIQTIFEEYDTENDI